MKDICLRLLASESETGVKEIIESVPAMRNQSNWRPLDKRDTNFNVTSNQASDGGKALTELMTNMVDAVLMKRAFCKGIDPKGTNAPKTMYDAVDVLVKKLDGGKLTNLDSENPWLREFAQKNLVIGITGAKNKNEGRPCYTFVDNGEGQQAQDFENTFLSLSAGNKKSISFVQGKYNMGSSGVLRYCGRRWFKLIVSRRYDGKSGWAWTLIRRRPDDGDDIPVAEYFILGGAEIPSFDGDYLYPLHTMEGKRYDNVMLKTGTVVKLFDYQIGAKFMSFKGAREALNENLIETILPFRIMDLRQLPKTKAAREKAQKRGGDRAQGVDSRPFYGMDFLLLRSHKEAGFEDEEGAAGKKTISVGTIDDPELGKVSIRAIVLKREIPGWLKSSNKRVFHAVNGQVQYKQTRGYLAQTCRFPALKDRVVIVVNASDLTFSAQNEVWKGDREHVSGTIVGEHYLDKVTTAIKESMALQDLQKKISREELEHVSKTQSNDLFRKLVSSDRNFAGLLSRRDPTIPMPVSNESDDDEWKGKHSPTFVRLEESHRKDDLSIPINRPRPLAARTDVENGYLIRIDNPGEVVIGDEVRTNFGIRQQLHDGRLTIYLEPRGSLLSVGDIFTFKVGLKDGTMAEVVESETLTLRVTEEQSVPTKRNGKNEPKKKNTPTLGLPKYILLTKDGRGIDGHSVESWPDGFGEHDGGVIEDLGEGDIIYKINYDNAYHLKYRLQKSGDVARDAITEKYILGMRILMFGYEHALRFRLDENDDTGESVDEFADDFRQMAARGAASTVLTLVENLPKIVDHSSIEGDVE